MSINEKFHAIIEKIHQSPLYEKRKLLLFAASLMILFWARNGTNYNDSDNLKAENFLPAALATSSSSGDVEQIVFESVVTFKKGDTFSDLLSDLNIEGSDIQRIIRSLQESKIYSVRSFRPDQEITFTCRKIAVESGENEGEQGLKTRVEKIEFNKDTFQKVVIARTMYGDYKAREEKLSYRVQIAAAEGEIHDGGLYASAQAQGVPVSIIHRKIELFSAMVDFQRDLQPGDRFQIIYEKLIDDHGTFVTPGKILYANLILSGEANPIYRYEEGKIAGYYTDKGESIRKSLLMTPVDGSRISSGYGMRRHPVLGYSRAHKGIDFAVSYGTPIKVAGDGVVTERRFSPSYGNHVRVRHNNGYVTVYAHMSRFNERVRQGSRVHQGDIIGHVGCTGICTGPHLHYEVLQGRTHINPRSLKSLPAEKLSAAQLNKFYTYVRGFKHQHDPLFKGKNLPIKYVDAR